MDQNSIDAINHDRANPRERPTPPSFSARAFGALLEDGGTSQWKQRELSLNKHPPYIKQLVAGPDLGTWREHILADIEKHIAELTGRLARFGMFRSLRSSNRAAGDDEAVISRMGPSLEETALAALASEMANYQRFSGGLVTSKQDLKSETVQHHS